MRSHFVASLRRRLRFQRHFRLDRVEALEPRLCLSQTALHLLVCPAVAADRASQGPSEVRLLRHEITGAGDRDHQTASHANSHLSSAQILSQSAAWSRHQLALHRPAGVRPSALHEHDHGPDRGGVLTNPGQGGSPKRTLFPGINQNGWVPPDDNLAVGPTRVVIAVNESLAVFDKTTGGKLGSDLPLPTLFPGSVGNSVFDPRVGYDTANGGHFILLGIEQSSSSRSSYLDIGVSKTSSPGATASDWYTYRFNVTQKFGRTSTWMDFESLGFDNQAVYVSGNMFGFGNFGSFQGVKLMTFNKTALESGQTVTAAANTQIITDGAFGLQAAVASGSATTEYFIEDWTSSSVRIHAVSNPLGTMTRSTATVSVPAYGLSPPDAPQKGSSNLVATNDTRMINAVWVNGSLWAAHTIQNTSTNKSTAQWYQISTNGVSGTGGPVPTLVQSGRIDPGTGIYTFFPSVSADANGNAVFSFAESSSSIYPAAYYTTHLASGALGSTTTQQLIQAGATFYTGSRWGDYSGSAIDPSTTNTFWVVGESVLSSGAWGTWFSKVTV